MMLQIENFLQAEAVAMLLDLVEQGRFEDGRATAGAELQSVKANEQLRITEREGRVIQKVLLPAMERNQAFQSFAWPRRLHVPRLSRYRSVTTRRHSLNCSRYRPTSSRCGRRFEAHAIEAPTRLCDHLE